MMRHCEETGSPVSFAECCRTYDPFLNLFNKFKFTNKTKQRLPLVSKAMSLHLLELMIEKMDELIPSFPPQMTGFAR